jgi:hypothetical protein
MDNRRTRGVNITTLPSEILEIMAAKVVKTSPTPLDDIVSLHCLQVIHGLVHHFIVIMTNGNAPQLLVEVHGLSQCDDGKEGGRGSRAEGLQHILQTVDNRHDEATYIFGILTIEYNNLSVEVEEALLHVDKFNTPSLSDRMIQEWIYLVRWKTVITLKRYEKLCWGH